MSLVDPVVLPSILTAADSLVWTGMPSLVWTGMPSIDYTPRWLYPRSRRERKSPERRRRHMVTPTPEPTSP